MNEKRTLLTGVPFFFNGDQLKLGFQGMFRKTFYIFRQKPICISRRESFPIKSYIGSESAIYAILQDLFHNCASQEDNMFGDTFGGVTQTFTLSTILATVK